MYIIVIIIKSPKDESFVSESEGKIRSSSGWSAYIAGRHAYVRDFVLRVWSLCIVRITGKARITFP